MLAVRIRRLSAISEVFSCPLPVVSVIGGVQAEKTLATDNNKLKTDLVRCWGTRVPVAVLQDAEEHVQNQSAKENDEPELLRARRHQRSGSSL